MILYSHSAHYYPAYLPVQLHSMMINMQQKKLKVFFGTKGNAGHNAYRRNNQTLVTQPLFDDF